MIVVWERRRAESVISIMFGGFSDKFFNAYHEVIPRLEPHYDERLDLYRLYHELNHAAMCKSSEL